MSQRLPERQQAAKTERTRNTVMFPGQTHTRVTYTVLGFWWMNDTSHFLQLLQVLDPLPQSGLCSDVSSPEPPHARCSLRLLTSSTVSPSWLYCPLGHSTVAWNTTIDVYHWAPLILPPSKHLQWDQASGSPGKCFDLLLCPERRLKAQKRRSRESDVLNRHVGDATQQKLMKHLIFRYIIIRYLPKSQNDDYYKAYRLSPYTAVFSCDEDF